MNPERAKRSVLIAGLAVPAGLLFTIALLTLVQWDFARSLGWHPWRAAMFDWPSGLALGPYGRALTVAFLVCAGALLLLAISRLVPSRAFAVSCVVVAVGMVGLAFDTDPTLARKPATWHGRLHDAGFITMGLGLVGHADGGIGAFPAGRSGHTRRGDLRVSAANCELVCLCRGRPRGVDVRYGRSNPRRCQRVEC
jgi:hypothetical protein